jgi:hypothetical protein
LVVLHLLFPFRFDTFDVRGITIRSTPTRETQKIIRMWKDMEKSKFWGPYCRAAEKRQYGELKDMADVFCSV